MQHWFDLLNTTQRDGSTTLTTRITAQGHTDGHANTALDYALNKVAAPDAKLDVNWQFTDPITNTNGSGKVALEGIQFGQTRDVRDNGSYVIVTYSYRANTSTDTRTGRVAQGYSRPGGRSGVTPMDVGAVNGYTPPKPNLRPGSIHVPIAVISYAIRAAMTVPEELTVRSGTEVEDVRSARWDPYWGRHEYPTTAADPGGAYDDRVQCSLPGGERQTEPHDLEIGYLWWSAPKGQDARPGVHANQEITLEFDQQLNGTIVVNPDLRTGSMQASGRSTRVFSGLGTHTVSGRWVCPPSSVTGGAFS